MILTDAGPFVVWAEPGADGVVWRTMVSDSGTALRSGAELPRTAGLLSFFELGRAQGGAVLSAVTRQDRVDAVSATLLRADQAGVPQELSAAAGEVLWVASAPERRGARVLWARLRGSDAEIGSAVLSDAGRASPSETVRTGAIGWQLASGPTGTWLATLEGSSAAAKVVLTRLDAPAQDRKSIELLQGVEGADQIDLAVGEAGVVVVFREEHAGTPRLRMVSVDRAGQVGAARLLTPPRSEQSLLALVSGDGSEVPWLAWEEPALDGPAWRRVLLSRFEAAGIAGPEAWLDVQDEGELFPALAGAARGIFALTRAPACSGPECSRGPSGLSVSRLEVGPAGRPVVKGVGGLPPALDRDALCWDLDCLGSECAVLCAESDTPTPVHFVRLDGRPVGPGDAGTGSAQAEPLRVLVGGPRLLRRDTLATVPALSDVALAPAGAGLLLSWVTDFDPSLRPAKLTRPAPDGRMEPYQADVRTLLLRRNGERPAMSELQPLADTVISHRARSLGGVSLSPERQGRHVLGWAALDQGRAHVFATLLDAQGKKLKQRLLGRQSGEVTDVQALATASGFLLMWIDDRSGRGQIYAQAVDQELNQAGPERTLTSETKAPIGLHVLAMGSEILLTFADESSEGQDGVFVMSVDAASLAPVVPPRKLPHLAGHAHSPQFFVDANGDLCIAFIEERETSPGEVTEELRLSSIDAGLRPARAPRTLLPNVNVSSFSLGCAADGCRAVMAGGVDRSEVWAAASADGTVWNAQFLMAHGGEAAFLPPPLLVENDAFIVGPTDADGFVIERIAIDFGADNARR